ncbi:M16 family metallopeptidase [Arenimonas sp.]|uniref:M16 family metallopeptidase n=1 Tax=Arenimonas sp. TaxID=1872635 RepID=UPI0039E60E19
MRPNVLTLALALALAPSLSPATPPVAASTGPSAQQLAIKHEKIVLPNGLTVLVHEDHSVPLVAVNLWYHVGSRDEKRGRTGFAHLFEHFFFNGSENYPHGFREAMDDLGANNRNGTTSTDRTNFFEDVPVSALERTLYLEADRMGFLAGNINEAMLERERGVVQNEKRQGENQPYGRVWDRVSELMYPTSHPYSWSTIGSMEDLNAAKLDDIKQWYATYYGPNNAVLSLAGDITPEQARALAMKYFGPIPAGPPLPRLKAWVPELTGNIRDTLQDRVPQARIYRVWHLPPAGDRTTHAMELFASVLSGSESSPLDRSLVFDKKLATSVSAGVDVSELGGMFYVTVTSSPMPSRRRRARDGCGDRARIRPHSRCRRTGRARTVYLADFARNTERLGGFGGRSDVLAESVTYFGARTSTCAAGGDRIPARRRREIGCRQWLAKHYLTMTVMPFRNSVPASTASTASICRRSAIRRRWLSRKCNARRCRTD